MNRFSSIQKRAAEEWQALQQSTDPVVYVGMGSCGLASGAGEVWKALQQSITQKKEKLKLIKVGCIGPCYLEPFMDIQAHGSPRLSFNNVDPERAEQLIKGYVKLEDTHLKPIGHLGDPGTVLNGTKSFWNLPMLKNQKRIVLRNCGIVDPENIMHYIAREGFQGIINALNKDPEKVIAEIKVSGLRGRGGAGFPSYRKWEFCRNAKGIPKYLICNADEGDPGAFMNRSLIEGDPFALLEGMLIAAYGIGANFGYIYIRAEYPLAIHRLNIAIAQMSELGLLGKNILGSGFDFEVKIKEGAGAFVCGEETALIASIEGKRGMPRSRPPFPAISGLNGKPTTIHNVETLASIPNILRKGGEWYAGFGTEQSKGTKTFALVGKVRRTGLIEVALGTTLREIIFDIGGGSLKKFKAVQTGGPSGGCLSEEFLDLPIDYQSLQDAGSIMGSGGLIVMDENSCMVDVAQYFLRFTSKESCGKCTPCRIGTRKMVEVLEKITVGKGTMDDLAALESLSHTIRLGSLCGLGQTAPNPVHTTIKYFRDEYVAHIEDKRCPAAVCRDLVEYRVIKEKCTGCQRCVEVCPADAITGPRSEPHNLDLNKCIKCRACYEICRFDAIAGDAIIIE
ncbi:MAG: NADH-quinone oxidoreductase subunit NuoF [Bacteroidota bacterium]|nr:NADH-quinone oxidoreductase subunit NuoF [Bacteroidota bacterium]